MLFKVNCTLPGVTSLRLLTTFFLPFLFLTLLKTIRSKGKTNTHTIPLFIPSSLHPFQYLMSLLTTFLHWENTYSILAKKVVILSTMLGIVGDTQNRRHPLVFTKIVKPPGHVNPGKLPRNYGKPGTLFSVCTEAWGIRRALFLASVEGTSHLVNPQTCSLSRRALNTSQLKALNIEMLPGYRDPYSSRPLTRGEIGCFLSHYSVWKEVDGTLFRCANLSRGGRTVGLYGCMRARCKVNPPLLWKEPWKLLLPHASFCHKASHKQGGSPWCHLGQ